jgi:hypothetical protein
MKIAVGREAKRRQLKSYRVGWRLSYNPFKTPNNPFETPYNPSLTGGHPSETANHLSGTPP